MNEQVNLFGYNRLQENESFFRKRKSHFFHQLVSFELVCWCHENSPNANWPNNYLPLSLWNDLECLVSLFPLEPASVNLEYGFVKLLRSFGELTFGEFPFGKFSPRHPFVNLGGSANKFELQLKKTTSSPRARLGWEKVWNRHLSSKLLSFSSST